MDTPFPDMNAAKAARQSEETTIRWTSPVDFIADTETPAPELQPEHVPDALWPFVSDTADRMGVDKTSVALGSLVSCASVITDDWHLQPRRHDYTWTEQARLWGAIVGNPSIMKTPIISACTRPIDRLDAAERERHQQAKRDYARDHAEWKKAADPDKHEPRRPLLARYLVEGSTVEAISEVLRDDDEATQYAPARKVLSRHDEMSEFFANLDRYRAGGKGGGDRGAWLRLYNGGRYTIDRIIRGVFSIPNWSACFLGGIQPGPIQQIAKDAVDDGLLQRFLFAVPGPQRNGQDRAPDRTAIARYDALFPILASILPRRDDSGRPSPVVLHEQGHTHREFVDNLALAMAAMPDASTRLQSSYGKWRGLFARIALTFHIIDIADARANNKQPPPIDVIPEDTTRRVARFMRDIVLPNLLRADALMYRTTQTGHARWIAGFILAHKMERITARDITRAYGDLRAPECRKDLADVMASLVIFGWLEPEDPKNALKSVHSWLVNPAAHNLFEAKAEGERARRQRTKEAIAATVENLRTKSGI